MRKGQILLLVGIGVVAGGIATAVAVLPTWLPVQASREAGRIDFVIWFTIVICIVIFAIVTAAMGYSIIKFRARPGDDEDGPPIHGHTGLEITWTLIPLVIVTAIAIVSAVVLSRNSAAGDNPLRVNVTAVQFAWTFTYPDSHGLTSNVLRLPKDRSVMLTISSKDVIHSFWVPEFGQKQDAVPGLHTTLHITPDRLGSYPVICVELCGLGHSVMRSTAIVMTPAGFAQWIKSQTAAIASPNASVVRRRSLHEQRLRRMSHADRREGHGQGRAGSRQAAGERCHGEPAAGGLHPRVDHRPEQVHRARIPEERDAGDVRRVALEAAARRARPISDRLEQGVRPTA